MRLPEPYRAEQPIVEANIARAAAHLAWERVIETARPWVEGVRRDPPPFWAMESLLKEYPISKPEGLALMRLAEALLRVPDSATAVELTADQLSRANFDGSSDSSLARLSNTVIALSKRTLPDDDQAQGVFAKLGAKTIVAATARAVQLLAKQFVLGQNIEEALQESAKERKHTPQLRFSFDMLGEGARTSEDAARYFAAYEHAIRAIIVAKKKIGGASDDPRSSDGISIKLSALHPRYEELQKDRVMSELVPRVWSLADLAASANINLTVDAEEVDRLELSLDVFDAVLKLVAHHHPSWTGFGLALQAYQTRSVDLVECVADMAKRAGVRVMCRLVKGAYWDSEIKRAQELGLSHYPVFTEKQHSDSSYLACATVLLARKDVYFPQFATHNAGTIAAIEQIAQRLDAPFELQRLHGMGGGVYREYLKTAAKDRTIRVYAPVGSHRDLLAYLVRRLLENGANSSFVHQLADDGVAIETLLESPLRVFKQTSLVLPKEILGKRMNSSGIDLSIESARSPITKVLSTIQLYAIAETSVAEVNAAFSRATSAQISWRDTPVETRAHALRTAADALERDLPRFCGLLILEAHKTWGDTVAEVREAIDFLRYYADEAERIATPIELPGPTGERNTLYLRGRGTWVAISPWNFPLAIFVGQIAAALATGNTVIAKPAEQTPVIANEMAAILHAAGVPKDALQLVFGLGHTVGAALVSHPNAAGVVFTGSTAVAKIIQRTLAQKDGPIVPLIAETGGINAMLVDSTALPEHVVDAVVQSAFRSAGQRCSALRVLCVHEAIADGVIEMLKGAIAELRVAAPKDLATDVGPLIDAEAFTVIQKHIERLNTTASLLAKGERSQDALANTVVPHLFEVGSLADIKEEIFGPVLQLVRWRGEPEAIIDQVNALGFGLTLGIHTRIDRRAQSLASRAHVGNVYINRNIIGAVVGVQPFGGEGLSGTGPKAGGPHYLYRFCAEQTITVNTVAAGGNVALMTS
ncbi:MAG: L-glutamate gamma-semialdehyde dehydrogenase [Betaproteobacteria bacterium]|nr:MAG: L-glutamate gamma-semialdehyde dehydrogenase [Betaproteobacteria bacterium]